MLTPWPVESLLSLFRGECAAVITQQDLNGEVADELGLTIGVAVETAASHEQGDDAPAEPVAPAQIQRGGMRHSTVSMVLVDFRVELEPRCQRSAGDKPEDALFRTTPGKVVARLEIDVERAEPAGGFDGQQIPRTGRRDSLLLR